MWRQHILPSTQSPALRILFIISALIFISALYSPNYLKYADQPIKADAVVLFIGPPAGVREKEANKLLEAGYADFLIIPAYNRIFMKIPHLPASIDGDGRLKLSLSLTLRNGPLKIKNTGSAGSYPHFYENTHIEVLEAKRIMDRSGFKKANFVSSPSHMRRIKMMTEHVFQQKNSTPDAYQIKFVPAIVESSEVNAPPWDLKYIGAIATEYIKIAWFYSYNVFSYNSRSDKS